MLIAHFLVSQMVQAYMQKATEQHEAQEKRLKNVYKSMLGGIANTGEAPANGVRWSKLGRTALIVAGSVLGAGLLLNYFQNNLPSLD